MQQFLVKETTLLAGYVQQDDDTLVPNQAN